MQSNFPGDGIIMSGSERRFREYELEQIIPFLQPEDRILEIGAGAGWQAKALSDQGFSVIALEIPQSSYLAERIWPVLEYDGDHLPFANDQFDVVYSSNVLEHIPDVERFQKEIMRVLKVGGKAIHTLPTSTFRIWTTFTFYVDQARKVRRHVFPGSHKDDQGGSPDGIQKINQENLNRWQFLLKNLFPSRHGARGNLVSEVYLFSRFRWIKLFQETGWAIQFYFPNRLFYTGYQMFGDHLSLASRRYLSYLLGSSCQVFCLTRPSH
jgi:2-polyprenyl-3-methyl-5-hydroxy-6-metoxy-1,4-benzoquinol methylase